MSKRFQIEEIIAQSALGVVFHATDVHSGQAVALRRFFPFGADGGGLTAEEQAVYQEALARVAGVAHPALRAVVAGGCDPVDGMPFVATEWVEGHALAEVLQPGKLKPMQAVLLLVSALEVSAVLAQTLEVEAVWVDTRLSSIVVGDAASGRGATFWLSTARWLDGGASVGSLLAILQLAEELLGWCGRGKPARDGLGQWIRWLRVNDGEVSLAEAHARLVAVVAASESSIARPGPVFSTAQAPPPVARSLPRWVVAGVAGMVAVALSGAAGWWWLTHRPHPPPVVARAAVGVAPDLTVSAGAAPPPAAAAAVEPNGIGRGLPVFAPGQIAGLQAARNREVIVEGVLVEVVAPRSGKHIYLDFAKPGGPFVARGVLFVEGAGQADLKASLDTWVGKRVRIVGKVDFERARDGRGIAGRLRIALRGRDVVELME